MGDGSTDAEDTEGSEESVDETLDQLADTVGDTAAGADDEASERGDGPATEHEGADGTGSHEEVFTVDTDADALVARATEDIESLLAGFRGDESIEQAKADIDDLLDVVEEAGELLESIDPAALAGAVDPSELPEAVEIEELPEAAAEADPDEAIDYRKLIQLVELGHVWQELDVREVWENKRELADEAEDLTDDAGDGTPLAVLRDTLDRLTEEDADAASDDDTTGSEDELVEASGAAGGDDRDDLDVPTDVAQQRIQSELDDAIAEFREGLLDVRDRLESMKAENRRRTENVEQPSSRNPTAYSTLSTADSRATHEVAKHSTVPSETKYSTAPNRDRLYGSRLERRGEDDE